MRQLKRIPMTREGFDNLKKELDKLKSERPQAVKNLSEARAMGDLSENGLYTAAKARLRSMDSQIFRLEMHIKLADIREAGGNGAVEIGSTVEVSDGDKKRIFQVVGDLEASPFEGKISQNSPLGKALLGKKVKETVSFETPGGRHSYIVESIR